MCIENLHASLKKGGVLFIVDWLPKEVKKEDHIGSAHAHPDTPHHHHHHHSQADASQQTKKETEQETEKETDEWKKMKKTIKTNGFTEEDMKAFFEGAGFTDFGFVVL